MKYFKAVLILIFFFSVGVLAQNAPYDCSTEPKQFDFWIGNWELKWNDTLTGVNNIYRDNDCLIHENFASEKRDYLGQSFTVYDPKKGKWKQTWVDNQNAYLLFTGSMVNDEMILNLDNPSNSDMKRQRLTDIHLNNFVWYWETSTDNGVSWKPLWIIYYTRKNK